MKRSLLLLAAVSVLALPLASCGRSRTEADLKLSAACIAGVKAMYDADDTLEPKDTVFQSEKSHEDTNLRVVRIHAIYTHNHGVLQEKDYACAFEETSGLFGYKASFYWMTMDDRKLGNVDGIITGGLDELMKLNNTIEPVLR